MLEATGFTSLLVNFKSMTSKPNSGGDSKDCVAWKVEKAVHYFIHGFFYGLGKRAAATGGLSHMGRCTTPLQTSPQIFEHFLAPGDPGREWGRMLVLHIQDASE